MILPTHIMSCPVVTWMRHVSHAGPLLGPPGITITFLVPSLPFSELSLCLSVFHPNPTHPQSMQPTLKYALPGGDAPLFVALGADADVANMWEEWEEGAAATPGAPGKLQLFLEVMSQPDNQQQQKQVQQEERVDREQPQQQQPAAGQGGAVAGLASSTTLAATAMATATTAPVAPATPTTSTGASRSGRGGGGGQGARGQLPAAGDSASPGGPPAARQACSQLSPFATSPFQQVAAVTFDQGSPGTAGVGLDRQHGEQGSEQH